MAVPIPVVFVKAAPTFFKAVRPSDTSEITTSASYVDVPNFGSIASVPDTSKLLSAIRLTKSTGGNALARVTDGTTTFKEYTHTFSPSITLSDDLDGSTLQSSGGAATVKMQFKSSDGNNATINPNNCFILATNGDAPMVLRGPLPTSTIRIPWKVSVEKLFLYYGGNLVSTTDQSNFNGVLPFEEILDNVVKSSELTYTYPNEIILNYFELVTEDNMVANQFLIFDWSGHGASFA